jgi:hypothetical protein
MLARARGAVKHKSLSPSEPLVEEGLRAGFGNHTAPRLPRGSPPAFSSSLRPNFAPKIEVPGRRAGGKRIRTIAPSVKDTAMEQGPRAQPPSSRKARLRWPIGTIRLIRSLCAVAWAPASPALWCTAMRPRD